MAKQTFEQLIGSIADIFADRLRAAMQAPAKPARRATGVRRIAAKRAVVRDMTCIAPGCGQRSKGPRFRFLCERHLKAPLRQVEKWREARR